MAIEHLKDIDDRLTVYDCSELVGATKVVDTCHGKLEITLTGRIELLRPNDIGGYWSIRAEAIHSDTRLPIPGWFTIAGQTYGS